MNWDLIRSSLKSAVELVDGLTQPGAVEWGDTAAASAMRKLPRIDLSARSLLGVGQDEDRIVDNTDNTTTPTIVGLRTFVFSMRIESDKASSGEAMQIASNLRALLPKRRDIAASLHAAGVAFSGEFQQSDSIDYKVDGRALVVVVLDATINAVEGIADTQPDAGLTIARVTGSITLTRPDGTTTQAGLDVSAPT